MSGHLPSISVIVPTFNRADLAVIGARAILTDEAVLEVIMVNDASADDTAAQLATIQDPRLHVINLEINGGRTNARQRGLDAARGDVVLLLDDDVIAGPHLASRHAAHHAEDRDALVVGYMPVHLTAGSLVTSRIYAREYEGVVAAYRQHPETVLRKLWGGNLSLRREHALRIGLASEGIDNSYHEDQDFGLRAEVAGLHGVFDERLAAEHRHHRDLDGFLRDAENRGFGLRLIRERYGDIALDPTPPSPLLASAAVGRLARAALTPFMHLGPGPERAAVKALRRLATYRGARRYQQGTP